jgi:hypothetical protein
MKRQELPPYGRERGIIFIIFIVFIGIFDYGAPPSQETPQPAARVNLLKLLDLAPSPESVDYVQNKTQFQLHTLLTEQRHPKTWNLSERVQKDPADGLRMLLSVDEDISQRLKALAADEEALERLVTAVEQAVGSRRTIYVYGCGATGRLAKQIESQFWRPYWRRIKADGKLWPRLSPHLSPSIEEGLIGEMTGGDRALISSLEGFEDLQLIGRLQLADRNIRKGDVVICVTEGGETSSVIGTILAALDGWKVDGVYDPAETRKKLFFVYNNPDDLLLPFQRSRRVIEEPGITRINLTTGPQAITGSTRMQATTSETFVIGSAIETAVERVLRRHLSKREMVRAGFAAETSLQDRLAAFPDILEEVKEQIPAIAAFTSLEAETYGPGRFSTYFAGQALITVFIDSTERSPTFRLFPLDTVDEPKRKCWIQVWTAAADLEGAWQAFLGRPFRGLAADFYREPFEAEIDDPYLKTAALESLNKAGDSQRGLYDFSFAKANVKKRGPKKDDLGVMIIVSPEDEELKTADSPFRRFARLVAESGARLALIVVGDRPEAALADYIPGATGPFISLRLTAENDPFGVRRQTGLKMLLNAHSTAVMTKLGRVIGNTMTNVSPSNLKLIGRATYLIQSHVNDVIASPAWVKELGYREPIAYGAANAVLFEAISFLRDRKDGAGQTAEVALSIIRILESFRLNRAVSNEEALALVRDPGLAAYLAAAASDPR